MNPNGPPVDTSNPLFQSLSSLLQSLSAIVKHSGIDKNAFLDLATRCYEEAEVPATPQRYQPLSDVVAKDFLSEMIRVWWSNPNYLDDMAEPIPVPKTGPTPSLEALYEQCRLSHSRPIDSVSFDAAIAHLIRARSIHEHCGQYIPLSRYFMTTSAGVSNTNAQIQYVANYLHTAAHNAFSMPGEGNFQRVAHAARLPIEKLPFIRSLLLDQGMSFLEQIDSAMEDSDPTESVTSESTASVTVGVYLSVENNEPSDKH